MDHRIRRINRRRGESLANPAESKHQTCLRSSTSLIRGFSPLVHIKFHIFMIQDISGKFHRFLKIRTFLQKIAVAFVQMSNFICPSAQNVPTTHGCYEKALFVSCFCLDLHIDLKAVNEVLSNCNHCCPCCFHRCAVVGHRSCAFSFSVARTLTSPAMTVLLSPFSHRTTKPPFSSIPIHMASYGCAA